jgi:rubrerythrin
MKKSNGPTEFYELTKHQLTRGGLRTATVWGCSLCGTVISGMGGPSNGTICTECGDAIVEGKFDRGELTCTIKPTKK